MFPCHLKTTANHLNFAIGALQDVGSNIFVEKQLFSHTTSGKDHDYWFSQCSRRELRLRKRGEKPTFELRFSAHLWECEVKSWYRSEVAFSTGNFHSRLEPVYAFLRWIKCACMTGAHFGAPPFINHILSISCSPPFPFLLLQSMYFAAATPEKNYQGCGCSVAETNAQT